MTLTHAARRFRTLPIPEETVRLRDGPDPVRQIADRDLGHDRPTLLITNQSDASPRELMARHARRTLIAEAIDYFHMDALSAVLPAKVDVDVQLTFMASALRRILARRIGNRCGSRRSYGRHACNPFLANAELFERAERLPWLGDGRCASAPSEQMS